MNAHLLRQIFSTFLVAFTFLNGSYLFAQNTSITNGSWGTPANWSLGHVPLAAEDVVIAHNVTISAAATCANITIQTGKSLDLSGSNTLTVGNNLTIESGSTLSAGSGSNINIGYQWIDDGGTFNAGDGTVTFNSQSYYCYITGTKLNQTFNNITVAMGTHALDASGLPTLTLNGSLLFKGSPASANKGSFFTSTTMTVKKDVTFESGYLGGMFTPMTLYVGGNWTNNATGGERQAFNTYDAGMWTRDKVVFNGTSPQTINGNPRIDGGSVYGQNFQGITIDNPTTVTVGNAVTNLFINDNLTILQGALIYAGTTTRNLFLYQRDSPECLVLSPGTALNTNNNNVTVGGDVKQTGGTVNSTGIFRFFVTDWWIPQHVPTGSYTNLYFDDNPKTLNPGTIKVAGAFRAGTASANSYSGVSLGNVVTGNTMEFTATGAQTVPSFNVTDSQASPWYFDIGYGGLKFSGGTKTLAGHIGVSEAFDFPGNITLGTFN
ncbi:MAG: hypothetical protein K1X77_01390, partial [Bacteroidia bacterium]|nr:hypothetical protein [Bacteroidia bacterium]